MPTVPVLRDLLFEMIGGKTYTQEEFDDISFEFGLEIDEITTLSKVANRADAKSADASDAKTDETDPIVYKFDVAANRYDLLCLEGVADALNVYLNYPKVRAHRFVTTKPTMRMNVKKETQGVRPFVVCAVLRNVTFDSVSYQSFLDLQSKLHDNICRGRKLVAIGTHDLNTLTGNVFTYEAKDPKDIRFNPLVPKNDKIYGAKELLDYYRDDKAVDANGGEGRALKPYTDIIYGFDRYPVIYDGAGVVLSLPPIINGDHSKMSRETKDVFVECTAVDETKANIVLNMMVTMFARYCAKPFQVEQVEVHYESSGVTKITPDLSDRVMQADVSYINALAGTPDLPAGKICENLAKMMLDAEPSKDGKMVVVKIPPTRSDILHACDIAEDAAIGYGYSNLETALPPTNCVGKQQPVNYLTELLRSEIGLAGFQEVLTLGLNSRADNFDFLRRTDDKVSAVTLINPVTIEFQVCRTTLLSGILKQLANNVSKFRVSEGVRAFEISDVVLRADGKSQCELTGRVRKPEDDPSGTGTYNRRHLSAVYVGPSAGFEYVHGLVDHLMSVVGIVPVTAYKESDRMRETVELELSELKAEYYFKSNDAAPTFFPALASADIFIHPAVLNANGERPAPIKIGSMGVLHPEVLERFEIKFPGAAVEIDIECLLELVQYNRARGKATAGASKSAE